MRKSIKQYIVGIFAVSAITLGVGAVVATPALADCNPTANGEGLNLQNGADCSKGAGQQTDLFGQSGIFKRITDVMLFIIGAISVIMLIIGGIRYVVSGGEAAAIQSAKNTILYAIVGVVISILAYAVVNFVVGSFAAPGQ